MGVGFVVPGPGSSKRLGYVEGGWAGDEGETALVHIVMAPLHIGMKLLSSESEENRTKNKEVRVTTC